jgi:hypothetical protein
MNSNIQPSSPAPVHRLVGRVLLGVREYAEDLMVECGSVNGRLVITAYNENGHNCTQVDILDLIEYLRDEAPELLEVPNAKDQTTGELPVRQALKSPSRPLGLHSLVGRD